MSQDSLKNKTVKGTIWSAADAMLGQGVTFLVGIVLARLLSPAEYGLIGICLIFTTVLNGIVDSGFSNSLIRKTDANNADYNTMFVTNLIISFILYIFLFFSAEYVAIFFYREELTSLIRATGLVLIINALSIVQVTILTKKLDFKTKTKVSLISATVSGFIGILMAYEGAGVWALVAQQLSKQMLYTIFLWIFNRWWPDFSFNISSFKYMWGFGWKLMASGLLNNIWNQLNQIVVGKYYTPSTLGQYTRGNEYANLFSANITSIIQRVSYPVLSEIQSDKNRLVTAYRSIIKMTMFLTCICMIYLGAISEPLIHCLLGRQWHEAATYLPLICVNMTLYPISAINLNMLQVQGRSDLFLYLEVVKKILAILPLLIGIYVGIYWMLVASIIIGVISFFLNTYHTGLKLGYSSFEQIKDIKLFYIIAFSISIPTYAMKFLPIPELAVLMLQVMFCIGATITTCRILDISEYKEAKKIISVILNKMSPKHE